MSEMLREATGTWWALFAPTLLQGTLVLLLVAVLDGLFLRRAWPELRSALWSVAMLRLVLPLSLLDASETLRGLVPKVTLPAPLETLASGSDAGLVLAAKTAFVAWLVGVVTTLGLLAGGYLRALRAAERAATRSWPDEVRDLLDETARVCGLRRAPALVGAPLVSVPFTASLLIPRIYLPLDAIESMSRQELRHVLLHELMHVKRRDAWRALAVAIVTALYWFHPLAWLATRRLEALREQCCDRAVARTLGPDAREYRKTLMTLGARALGLETRPSAGTPGFFGRSAGLVARLRVLEHEASRRTRLRQTLTALCCALLLSVLVPMTPASSEALHRIGEALERPPGCLLLRMEVLRRIAEEDAARGDK